MSPLTSVIPSAIARAMGAASVAQQPHSMEFLRLANLDQSILPQNAFWQSPLHPSLMSKNSSFRWPQAPAAGNAALWAVAQAPEPTDEAVTLEDAEREHVPAALHETGWVVVGPKGAAARLGMKRSSLQDKMKKLGIFRPK